MSLKLSQGVTGGSDGVGVTFSLVLSMAVLTKCPRWLVLVLLAAEGSMAIEFIVVVSSAGVGI